MQIRTGKTQKRMVQSDYINKVSLSAKQVLDVVGKLLLKSEFRFFFVKKIRQFEGRSTLECKQTFTNFSTIIFVFVLLVKIRMRLSGDFRPFFLLTKKS